jgi:hypothetical protein
MGRGGDVGIGGFEGVVVWFEVAVVWLELAVYGGNIFVCFTPF